MNKYRNTSNVIIKLFVNGVLVSVKPGETILGPESYTQIQGLTLIIPASEQTVIPGNIQPIPTNNSIKVLDEDVSLGYVREINFKGLGVYISGSDSITVHIPGVSGATPSDSFVEGTGISIDTNTISVDDYISKTEVAIISGALHDNIDTKIGDAPSDDNQYTRKNSSWVVVETTSGGFNGNLLAGLGIIISTSGSNYTFSVNDYISKTEIVQITGGLQSNINSKISADILRTEVSGISSGLQTQIINLTTNVNGTSGVLQSNINTKIGDAPSDGTTYGRKNGIWTSVATGITGVTSSTITDATSAGINLLTSVDVPTQRTYLGFSTITSITASRNLANSDDGSVLKYNGASQITLIVPSDLRSGWGSFIVQQGSGQIVLSGGPGVTINHPTGATKTSSQWATVSLIQLDPSLYVLGGSAT